MPKQRLISLAPDLDARKSAGAGRRAPSATLRPSDDQVAIAAAVVRWYIDTHHGRAGDLGLVDTFRTPERVGSFAVKREALERGDDDALFRLLVTVSMFQRLRDALVMNILRGISAADAANLTNAPRLAARAQAFGCGHAATNVALLSRCDLTKDSRKRGACSAAPDVHCDLKHHTELLRRYGHFGKVPTSAALAVYEQGGSLSALRERVIEQHSDPLARAQALEQALSSIWRVSDKIASFYLSLVCAPCMGLAHAPWGEGLDWTWYVVVDRNVDLFLESIGYAGNGTYSARREFVRALASRIDLSMLDASLPAYHPRLVQQAFYLFMSTSNRRVAENDCSRSVPLPCPTCPGELRARCGLRAR